MEHDSEQQELASPGCSRKWELWLPTCSEAPQELCQYLRRHHRVLKLSPLGSKRKIYAMRPMWEEVGIKKPNKGWWIIGVDTLPAERGVLHQALKRHLAGTGYSWQPVGNGPEIETTQMSSSVQWIYKVWSQSQSENTLQQDSDWATTTLNNRGESHKCNAK